MKVKNPFIFFGVAALVLAYLVSMMVRRRKGDRPDATDGEPEL